MKLSDIDFPTNIVPPKTPATDDVVGKTIVVQAVQLRTGDKGEYLRVSYHLPQSDEAQEFNTGGFKIMAKLLWLDENGKLPVELTVKRDGRVYDVE